MNTIMMGHDARTEEWLMSLNHTVTVVEKFTLLDEYDLLVIPGGSTDVWPELYREEKHPKTFFTDTSKKVDILIYQMLLYALDTDMNVLGICKGAQAVCVANGGSLYQHIGNQTSHDVKFPTGEKVHTVGQHHQAMKTASGEILAVCCNTGYPELVRWDNMLAVQWHPEWMGAGTKGRTIIEEMIS